MASILICATPAHGHVAPLLAVATELVRRGDRVRFLTGRRFADAVAATGAGFCPLPDEADFDDRTIDADHPRRAGLTGPAVFRHDFREIFLRPALSQYRLLRSLIEAEPVTVVLAEPLFIGAIALVLRDRADRPVVIGAGILPLGLTSRDTAPFGLGIPPMRGVLGRLRNRVLTVVAQRIVFRALHRECSRTLEPVTGRGLPVFFMDWQVLADGLAQFTVPGFEYPRSDLPPTVRFIGPVARSPRPDTPLPDWWDELSGQRRVILVTQGTVANADPGQLAGPAMAGLAGEDALVVVTTGGADVRRLPHPLPDNVRVAPFLPFELLLPRVDVLVTNGGYGGVHFALRHGVPMVVAGATEDKAEVSARVVWSGAGVGLGTNTPEPAAVARAVRTVLRDPGYARAAERLAAEIAAAPGVAGLAEMIDAASAARQRDRAASTVDGRSSPR
ncbi:glycosyl transferase [Amycolatopsis antarctica]|uniref:Glycosyl transferase n=1 Tax=Amycolatopsis antarctica TaxID=1854586 RepID=A0A263D522_9PSEU|nr:nucleotide disphospho-sugar-binding domain-containing protein [Amycolatopsis antarctica]OZM73148.1 glycosyl transferase [Amycolatopsis antarctica]